MFGDNKTGRSKTQTGRQAYAVYLKSAGGVQRDRRGTVLLCNAVTGVAVRRVVVAEAAADHPALFEVGRAALARVAAHAVLSAAWLKDGLPGEGLPVFHVHEQPDGEDIFY